MRGAVKSLEASNSLSRQDRGRPGRICPINVRIYPSGWPLPCSSAVRWPHSGQGGVSDATEVDGSRG